MRANGIYNAKCKKCRHVPAQPRTRHVGLARSRPPPTPKNNNNNNENIAKSVKLGFPPRATKPAHADATANAKHIFPSPIESSLTPIEQLYCFAPTE